MTPERTLLAIVQLANHLAADFPSYLTVEANLARATLQAGGQLGGHGGDTPDPVHTISASHIRYWSTVEDLANALMYLQSADRTMGSVRRHHSELAAEHDTMKRQSRCAADDLRSNDGRCENLATRGELCWRHIKQLQREKANGADRPGA